MAAGVVDQSESADEYEREERDECARCDVPAVRGGDRGRGDFLPPRGVGLLSVTGGDGVALHGVDRNVRPARKLDPRRLIVDVGIVDSLRTTFPDISMREEDIPAFSDYGSVTSRREGR